MYVSCRRHFFITAIKVETANYNFPNLLSSSFLKIRSEVVMAFCFNFALMKNIYASIITIGDELLIGQVLDTNSAWIAQQLNKIGIALNNRISVGDDANEIRKALDFASKNSQVVLITGGLGPTNDDITKKGFVRLFRWKIGSEPAFAGKCKKTF